MAARVTLLGTGTSTGVPVIGCGCKVCTSDDVRDTRTRCAAYVEIDTECGPVYVVIDTGPDFRQQAIANDIRAVDAVLFTHHHFDHVVGVDDLRPFLFGNRTPIPCYADPTTAEILRDMFRYIFADGTYPGVPLLELKEIDGPLHVSSRESDATVEVTPLRAFHGDLPILGFRIGGFAYLTDVSRIPDATFARLDGLDVLVIDALRPRPHPTHFSIEQATEAAKRIGAGQTYFIHLTHNVLHAEADALLPDTIALGYDGLTFETD